MTSTTLSITRRSSSWHGVGFRGTKGARSAGVDGVAPRSIVFGARELLGGLREDLKARPFPDAGAGDDDPQGERETPPTWHPDRRRPSGASLLEALVLEPIFEAELKPCSYGFRPKRRTQDAIAEIHFFASPTRNYEWVFEGDITACFDEIDHVALMGRVRRSIGDKRVLGLVRAFLKAGILSEDAVHRDTNPAPPKVGSSHRCWPTSHFLSLTSTSPRSGKHSVRNGNVPSIAMLAAPSTGSSAMRTTLWSWCPAAGKMPRRCATRLHRARSDGPAPVGREDEGLPHRRGVRLLGFRIQRRSSEDRTSEGVHLPIEEVFGLGDGKVRASPAGRGIDRSPTCCAS